MTAAAPVSINRTARLAGALYLALSPFAAFTFFYVPSVLFVEGDAAATSRNIMASELLFRSAVVTHLVTQVIFVLVILTLYRLLKPVNKDRAALMVVLALLSIPMAFLNEVHHLAVPRLLGSAGDGAFTATQLQAQAMLLMDMYRNGIVVTQILWGLWLLPLAVLIFRSGFLPKVLGILVVIGAAGYLFDSGVLILFPGFPTISLFTFVGELSFPVWLVIKGVNVARWQEVARQAA